MNIRQIRAEVADTLSLRRRPKRVLRRERNEKAVFRRGFIRHFGIEFSAGVVYAHQASDNISANLFHGTASGALVAYL